MKQPGTGLGCNKTYTFDVGALKKVFEKTKIECKEWIEVANCDLKKREGYLRFPNGTIHKTKPVMRYHFGTSNSEGKVQRQIKHTDQTKKYDVK